MLLMQVCQYFLPPREGAQDLARAARISHLEVHRNAEGVRDHSVRLAAVYRREGILRFDLIVERVDGSSGWWDLVRFGERLDLAERDPVRPVGSRLDVEDVPDRLKGSATPQTHSGDLTEGFPYLTLQPEGEIGCPWWSGGGAVS